MGNNTCYIVDEFVHYTQDDYEIEYIDEMGYVYVRCPQCLEWCVGCDRCMELTWALSEQFFALQDFALDVRRSMLQNDYVEESWD
ncbi:hypothetical protein M8J76_002905 [Diaphorina citri]|jgi:hypothetical protein|nr:hypothetical protein M8J76_002905 [Diaphorina citri]